MAEAIKHEHFNLKVDPGIFLTHLTCPNSLLVRSVQLFLLV
jgi:hypothetical protein